MSTLDKDTGKPRANKDLRQAVDNIQNRFFNRIALEISLSEISEELIIEALGMGHANYGCIVRAGDDGLLMFDAAVLIEADGTIQRQHDVLLDNQPDEVMRDVIDVLKPTYSNNPTDITLRNLPRSHPSLRCFAVFPLHKHGALIALLIVLNTRERFDLALVKRLQSMLDSFIRVHINSVVNRNMESVVAAVSEIKGERYGLLDASYVDSPQTAMQYRTLTQLAPVGILKLDEHWRCEYANEMWCRLCSLSLESNLGQDWIQGVHKDEQTSFLSNMRRALLGGKTYRNVIRLNNGSGRTLWVNVNAAGLYDSTHQLCGSLVVVMDITDQYDAEQRFRQIADHDPLTGLANRTRFLEHLHTALEQRSEHAVVSVLFIDLDGFKAVNDTLGHDVGDELLQQVAIRLCQCTSDGDTVARQGGDEFSITLSSNSQDGSAGKMADTLLRSLRRPFLLKSEEVYVSASIGIATTSSLTSDVTPDADSLIRQADTALYRAKFSGRSRHVSFTPELDQAQRERSVLIANLRRAVDHNDFKLYYQPQLLIKENRLLGFEALLRWPQASGEYISPATFIDVLEETGLIGEIGEWAISEACKQHGIWLQAGLISPATTMSVNVSARQLGTPHFAGRVATILQRHSMRPDSLILEITESALVETIETGIINDIKALGIQISLDDFGTGYSSLAYLSQLPLDHLKIDRSFIADLEHFPHAVTVVKSIIALANALSIRVIAEGVECSSVLPLLANEGCEGYQGFLFSKALPANQMEQTLAQLDKVRLSHYAHFIDLGESEAMPESLVDS